PFLNGMAQIDRLQADYPGQTLGGFVKIVGTVEDGAVHQLTDLAVMTIGGLGDDEVPDAVATALDVPGFRLQVIDDVVGGLWEKWIFIARSEERRVGREG